MGLMRYAHPTALHQADSVKGLEVFNAAKEIPEVDRPKRKHFREQYLQFPLHSPKNK
jgi:hypothetical protein